MSGLVLGEDAIGVFENLFENGKEEDLAPIGDAEARASMRRDLRTLGLLGTIASVAEHGPQDPAVRDEARTAVIEELGRAIGSDAPAGIPARITAYAEKRSARGRDLARRLVARTIFDLYDLQANGLSQDDLLRAADVIPRARAGASARDLAKRLCRLSRHSAQVVLGHIPDQLVLIHRIRSAEEVVSSEIDNALGEYAPRIYATRLPSIMKQLVQGEPKMRLALVIWGRLRGITLGRDALHAAVERIVPAKQATLLHALAKPEVRERMKVLAAIEAGPDGPRAREIEDALLDEDEGAA